MSPGCASQNEANENICTHAKYLFLLEYLWYRCPGSNGDPQIHNYQVFELIWISTDIIGH